MSENDDDLPLDALVKKHHSENNNGNNEKIIPLHDPDGPDPTTETIRSDDSDEEEEASIATSKSDNAQTLMQEILAEKKRKEDAYRIEKLEKLKKQKTRKSERRGSFVLRKEKVDKDDNSESDMDMSDDEEDKKQIETNVPMPAMMPRSISKTGRQGSPSLGMTGAATGTRATAPTTTSASTSLLGPKRVAPAAYVVAKTKIPQKPVDLVKPGKAAQIQPPVVIGAVGEMEEKQRDQYDLPELQNALDEILKELEKYKVTTKMSNEAVYWSTLVSERVPKWGLVDAIDIVPLRIVDANKEEKLNQAAINEIMGDLKKKQTAEQVEGVGAWKSRQKVNKMFLARTIKNQMVTELMFEKQRKVKQLNTEKAEEEKKKKKKQKRKQSTSSSSSASSDSDDLEIIGENDKSKELQKQREAEKQDEEARNVQPLPLPADMSKEERELTLKAIQELTREASAFVKGRNAKKMMGYEMGSNLNNDGSFKQGQQFVAAANQKLTSGAIQQAVTNAKQLATANQTNAGSLGELLQRKGVSLSAAKSAYLAEVGQLANCSFSDAILGYSWMSDAHWGVFPRPAAVPSSSATSRHTWW